MKFKKRKLNLFSVKILAKLRTEDGNAKSRQNTHAVLLPIVDEEIILATLSIAL